MHVADCARRITTVVVLLIARNFGCGGGVGSGSSAAPTAGGALVASPTAVAFANATDGQTTTQTVVLRDPHGSNTVVSADMIGGVA